MSEELKRRMPEYLQPYLLRLQGNKVYLPAQFRVVWFREECPDWSIQTEIVEGGMAEGFATVKATIRNAEGKPVATAHKTETLQDFAAGFIEKAETGAIGRALAVAGFGSIYAAELDELGDTEHVADAPVQRPVHAESRRAESGEARAASGPGFGKPVDYRARAEAQTERAKLAARLEAIAEECGVDTKSAKAVREWLAFHYGVEPADVRLPKEMSVQELRELVAELDRKPET